MESTYMAPVRLEWTERYGDHVLILHVAGTVFDVLRVYYMNVGIAALNWGIHVQDTARCGTLEATMERVEQWVAAMKLPCPLPPFPA